MGIVAVPVSTYMLNAAGVSNPQPMGRMPRMARNMAQPKIVNLLKTLWDHFVFIRVCAFTMCPNNSSSSSVAQRCQKFGHPCSYSKIQFLFDSWRPGREEMTRPSTLLLICWLLKCISDHFPFSCFRWGLRLGHRQWEAWQWRRKA